MTRMDSVRAATGTAKESVRHAAEVVAPYAGTARETAAHYAQEAGARLGPRVSSAARRARRGARTRYDTHLLPRFSQAREALPPQWDQAATRAARGTRTAARRAAEYTGPRIEAAREAAGPAREEVTSRSLAALAALRGEVTPAEIERLVRSRQRRAQAARVAKGTVVLGLVVGGAWAAWRWWERQANPDWLIEPPAATEVGQRSERSRLTVVDAHERGGEGSAPEREPEAPEPGAHGG